MQKEIFDRKGMPRQTAPMRLNEVSRLFDDTVRSLDKSDEAADMKNSTRLILAVLDRLEGVSQLDIVNVTHLKSPTVSLALKKMEEDGYVTREVNVSDMRAFKVYLTEKGKKFNEDMHARFRSVDSVMMQGISKDEEAVLVDLLIRMRNNLLVGLGKELPPREFDLEVGYEEK